MHEHESKECQDLISYITGECSELELAAFELHLQACANAATSFLPVVPVLWTAAAAYEQCVSVAL